MAPWICPAIRGDTVFDSERDKGTPRVLRPDKEVAAEFLPEVERFIAEGGVDAIPRMTLRELHEQLRRFHIDEGTSRWDKAQLQEALMALVESDYGGCAKMFVKPVGTSGGVMFAICPHGFIYAFKVLLKSESVSVSIKQGH